MYAHYFPKSFSPYDNLSCEVLILKIRKLSDDNFSPHTDILKERCGAHRVLQVFLLKKAATGRQIKGLILELQYKYTPYVAYANLKP